MHTDRNKQDAVAALRAMPTSERDLLLQLRALILETWSGTGLDTALTETLKWGQPAYLPGQKGIGTTLRLGVARSGEAALFVHCRTTLIDELHEMFPGQFRTEGNRAILFGSEADLHPDRLRILILRALTYHRKPVG